MCLETTDHTAKRLLVWPVLPSNRMAHTALLRRIGTLHSGRLYASFGSVPGDLLGNVCQIGSTHVGIHGSGPVLHRGNRKLFIGKLYIGVLGKALVDSPIDLLTDVPDKALPALAAGGRQFLDPFLFQALA